MVDMRHLLIQAALCLYLLCPLQARAGDLAKDPLNYPLKQYGLVLGIALLGGAVSWFTKVSRGEISVWSLMHLIGELATSAFAGLIAFWICDWANFAPPLTASLVGIAGHMGTRAITAFEGFAERKWGVAINGNDAP